MDHTDRSGRRHWLTFVFRRSVPLSRLTRLDIVMPRASSGVTYRMLSMPEGIRTPQS